ncbi:MAG: hypothetical protein WCH98_19615, partial [Verrucomicrobiota bacterium]
MKKFSVLVAAAFLLLASFAAFSLLREKGSSVSVARNLEPESSAQPANAGTPPQRNEQPLPSKTPEPVTYQAPSGPVIPPQSQPV